MRKNWRVIRDLPPPRGEVLKDVAYGCMTMLVALSCMLVALALGCFIGHLLYWTVNGP